MKTITTPDGKVFDVWDLKKGDSILCEDGVIREIAKIEDGFAGDKSEGFAVASIPSHTVQYFTHLNTRK